MVMDDSIHAGGQYRRIAGLTNVYVEESRMA